MFVLMLGAARAGVLPQLPHQTAAVQHRAGAVLASMRRCSASSLSPIFMVYTGASITRVFFISAASFGALSLYGYTTQRDLSAMGSFLIMGLIGIIIASLVNIFLKSSGLDFVDLGDRRAGLRRPDRLGHAEDQGDV